MIYIISHGHDPFCLGSPRRGGTPPATGTALARTWWYSELWSGPVGVGIVEGMILNGKLGEMIPKDISDLKKDGGFGFVASPLFFRGEFVLRYGFCKNSFNFYLKKNISVQQKLVGTPVWHVQSYLKLQVPMSIYPGMRIFQDPKSDPRNPLKLVSKKVLITIWNE